MTKFNAHAVAKQIIAVYEAEDKTAANRHGQIAKLGIGLNEDQIAEIAKDVKTQSNGPRASEAKVVLVAAANGVYDAVEKKVGTYLSGKSWQDISETKPHVNQVRLKALRAVNKGEIKPNGLTASALNEICRPKTPTGDDIAKRLKAAINKAKNDGFNKAAVLEIVEDAFAPAKSSGNKSKTEDATKAANADDDASILADMLGIDNATAALVLKSKKRR